MSFNRAGIIPWVFVLLGHVCWGWTWPVTAHTWGGSQTDAGNAVAVDSSGNVYVAGSTESYGAGGQDVLVTKYDSTGQFLWAKTWGGGGEEYATSIKVGPDGYLYVTGGTSSFGAGWYDVFLLKLDTTGNLVWGTTWGGSSYDVGHDIGFDSSHNVYVAAETYSYGPCCSSAALLRFSPGGSLLTAVSYKGPATYDGAYSLAVDSSFNVIIVGISWDYSSYSTLHNSILIVKYDPNGNVLWQENWATAYPGQDESWAFHAVTTDSAGNIYVGGRHSNECATDSFGDCDFDSLLLKLDPNGGFLWANTWGTLGTYDSAGSVVVNSGQTPLVTGMLDWYGTPSLFLLGYDGDGNLTSQLGWQGQVFQEGIAPGMALDAGGASYVASSAVNNQGSWAATTATSGALTNSIITNSYAAGVPNLSLTSVSASTSLQTAGTRDTGGGGADAFIAKSPSMGPWQRVKNPPLGLQASTALLLTDGSVLVQGYCLPVWWRLTPGRDGSYINGIWSKFPNSKFQDGYYGPLYYASAVLPSGNVIIEGGEYTFEDSGCSQLADAESKDGAILSPGPYWEPSDTSLWSELQPPSGWGFIGDAASVVLPDGQFMLGNCGAPWWWWFNPCSRLPNSRSQAVLSSGGWRTINNGKGDFNGEEGWTLLPGGRLLTIDIWNYPNFEIYDPNSTTNGWSTPGQAPLLVNILCNEIGPAVLRPAFGSKPPTVFALGGNGNTGIYDTSQEGSAGWSVGPSIPDGLAVADGPAALLPSGNVLVDASPILPQCYKETTSEFFELDLGSDAFETVPGPPNAGKHASYEARMLVLPTGGILYTDGTADVEVYTPSGDIQDQWRPTVTFLTEAVDATHITTLVRGQTYRAFGTQFNGLSQGAAYGDDAQSATNYPLIRITDQTGNIFYARTHDHSTMGVATGEAEVSTYFDVPPCPSKACLQPGPAKLEVVANGIASEKYAINLQ